MTSKEAVRRQVREALKGLPSGARVAAGDAVVARLAGVLPAGLVMAYVPLPDEVDLVPLLDRLALDDRLVLPRVDGPRVVPHRVRAPLGQLGLGAFGIHEPPEAEPVVAPGELAAVVVPGRAFDRAGRRLGRGRGFYDRFLATAEQALRVAVAFPPQVVPLVPTEPHDLPVDAVVTPDEVIVTGARGWRPAHAEVG